MNYDFVQYSDINFPQKSSMLNNDDVFINSQSSNEDASESSSDNLQLIEKSKIPTLTRWNLLFGNENSSSEELSKSNSFDSTIDNALQKIKKKNMAGKCRFD